MTLDSTSSRKSVLNRYHWWRNERLKTNVEMVHSTPSTVLNEPLSGDECMVNVPDFVVAPFIVVWQKRSHNFPTPRH